MDFFSANALRNDARVCFLECHDSFSGMIIDYLRQVSDNVRVVDHLVRPDLNDTTHLVLGPGPGTPQSSGCLMDWLSLGINQNMPILGICLGHQAIGLHFGARLERAPRAIHGEAHSITHSGKSIFENVPQNTRVARYHSLTLSSLPKELICIARTEDEQIMAICHIEKPIYGIQFHPESFLTKHGLSLIYNFLNKNQKIAICTSHKLCYPNRINEFNNT